MSNELSSELIVGIALPLIVCVVLALFWPVFRRWEAWSERRGRKPSPEPSVQFRAVAERMVHPEQFSRKRR